MLTKHATMQYGFYTNARRQWVSAEVERPEPDPGDVDAQFAQIVAGYHSESPPRPSAAFTELEDLSAVSGLTPFTPKPDEPGLLEGLDTFGADLPDEEDHFVPPPPPPLPRPTGRVVAAVLALGTGLALLLWPELLPMDTQLVMLIGFLGIMTGVATLIMCLRSGDDDDGDPLDDGARI